MPGSAAGPGQDPGSLAHGTQHFQQTAAALTGFCGHFFVDPAPFRLRHAACVFREQPPLPVAALFQHPGGRLRRHGPGRPRRGCDPGQTADALQAVHCPLLLADIFPEPLPVFPRQRPAQAPVAGCLLRRGQDQCTRLLPQGLRGFPVLHPLPDPGRLLCVKLLHIHSPSGYPMRRPEKFFRKQKKDASLSRSFVLLYWRYKLRFTVR